MRTRDGGDSHALGPHPIVVAALAACAAILFVVLRMGMHDWDVTALIRVGEDWMVADAPQRGDFALADGIGYDGQYYYRQALDPLSTAEVVDGIPFDRPVYRASRIAYPTAAWLLAGGGSRDAVPWALVGVNVLALATVAGTGAALARRFGRSATWGLVFAAWPGFVVGLGYDLAEPLEAALVLVALYLTRRGRTLGATALLTVAVLTRESALVVPAAFLAAAILPLVVPAIAERLGLERRRGLLAPALVPPLVWAGLQLWMAERFSETSGTSAAATSAEHVGNVPGLALVRQLGEWITSGSPVDLFQLIQVLVMICFFAAVLATLRARDAGTAVERVGLLGATLLVLMVGGYSRMVIYLRWPDLAAMFGLVVYLSCPPTRRPEWVTDRIVAGCVLGLYATTAPVWIWI